MLKDILNKETDSVYAFVHAHHSVGKDGTDIISVKYKEQRPDGTVIPHFEIIENFKRPYWVVREEFRKYKDKKTYEPTSRLKKGFSTQSGLKNALARELGYRNPNNVQLKTLLSSPYVYGLAPTVTAMLKHKISSKWKDTLIPNEVASSDIETDMINGRGTVPIMQGLTYKGDVHLAVTKAFLKDIENPKQAILDAIDLYIKPMVVEIPRKDESKPQEYIYLKDWCKKVTVDLCDTASDVCVTSLKRMHTLNVDIVTFWNNGFDIPIIIDTIEREKGNPEPYFNDPSVPPVHQYFNWYHDEGKQTTASGKRKFRPNSEKWNYLTTHAGFVFLDPMSFYRKNRLHLKQELFYTLDYLGNKIVNMGKLRFDKASHLKEGDAQWHEFMQKYYPVEYCAYCIIDCILVELIDHITQDLSSTIGPATDMTTYQKMFSLPSLLEHSYFFEMLEYDDVVLGQAGEKMEHELDKYVIGSEGIIVSLPSYLIGDNGIRLFKDMPDVVSQIRIGASDNDIRSAYPYGEMIFNLERENIERELTYIEGKDVRGIKEIGFLIAGGIVNSVKICVKAYNYPSLLDLQEHYEKTHPS